MMVAGTMRFNQNRINNWIGCLYRWLLTWIFTATVLPASNLKEGAGSKITLWSEKLLDGARTIGMS